MSAKTDVKYRLALNPTSRSAALRNGGTYPSSLPEAKTTRSHPRNKTGQENASVYFIGTATMIIEWQGLRLLTDPNFLHAGDHVHLGPGVTGHRVTDPAISLSELPAVDAVLLSHYHADHFDDKVEASLRRDLPIISTPHAKEHLDSKKSAAERFSAVYDLDAFETMLLNVDDSAFSRKSPIIKVTAMPGKHVPDGILTTANELLGAVPPSNGWMLELGYSSNAGDAQDFTCGYRIYISGDTLMVDELNEIPKHYADKKIDLMLVHLGGTTIPGPNMPLLMVTMDAAQGIQLMSHVKPEVTIPIHYDDYNVFLSPLSDFKEAVKSADWDDKVVYLDRADKYSFTVRT